MIQNVRENVLFTLLLKTKLSGDFWISIAHICDGQPDLIDFSTHFTKTLNFNILLKFTVLVKWVEKFHKIDPSAFKININPSRNCSQYRQCVLVIAAEK